MAEGKLDMLTLIQDRRPRQLLEAATGLGFLHGREIKSPGEWVDTGEPPRRIGDGEWAPIDECLGLYDPKRSRINLFEQGIRDASSMLTCSMDDLCLIVRVHEFAHALVHLGPYAEAFEATTGYPEDSSEQKRIQSKADRLFAKIPHVLHEQLAQILTYYALAETVRVAGWDDQTRQRCLGLFSDLMHHQPPPYRVFDLLEVPKLRVVKSLGLIRDRVLAADVDAWRAVVLW